jgi:hypothetical protein
VRVDAAARAAVGRGAMRAPAIAEVLHVADIDMARAQPKYAELALAGRRVLTGIVSK